MTFIRNRKGQGMTEYIIVVAIIAIAAVAAFKTFGSKLRSSVANTGIELETDVKSGHDNTKDGTNE